MVNIFNLTHTQAAELHAELEKVIALNLDAIQIVITEIGIHATKFSPDHIAHVQSMES